ncbi:ATP-binding protein [Streptomyces sp. A3M-1-3]|uniref:ATP-binding protein n=1 Tax=Streptomyces sp. A3M-1-3 TaxID=2962044 RepID=UPI0020B7D85B|nr:ATP-binding protein [Streptomyces sp. A3M-1-3]MCP3819077.1 ATP-binding protein [Streptomyces sp. A3M-1-3]
MTATASFTTCPDAADFPATPPAPDTLMYSLTLPAAAVSAAIARAAARVVLDTHGLRALTDPALQVVSELTTAACRFTASDEVYLSLRYRDNALRVILYDGHPRHTHPRLAAACDARRRSALRLLACVVRACDGDWGFGDAREPGGGTRMWAVLPHAGATAYGARP